MSCLMTAKQIWTALPFPHNSDLLENLLPYYSGINNLQLNAKLFLYRVNIWLRALPGWNLT